MTLLTPTASQVDSQFGRLLADGDVEVDDCLSPAGTRGRGTILSPGVAAVAARGKGKSPLLRCASLPTRLRPAPLALSMAPATAAPMSGTTVGGADMEAKLARVEDQVTESVIAFAVAILESIYVQKCKTCYFWL